MSSRPTNSSRRGWSRLICGNNYTVVTISDGTCYDRHTFVLRPRGEEGFARSRPRLFISSGALLAGLYLWQRDCDTHYYNFRVGTARGHPVLNGSISIVNRLFIDLGTFKIRLSYSKFEMGHLWLRNIQNIIPKVTVSQNTHWSVILEIQLRTRKPLILSPKAVRPDTILMTC